MNKVVVTGVGGYIASHAAQLLLQQGFQVVGIDNYSTGYAKAVEYLTNLSKQNFSFHKIDLTDKESLENIFRKEPEISDIMHFAASCNVNESMENPYKYFTNNVSATLTILECMKNHSIHNIVFSSTCALYGTPQHLPIDETHPAHPDSPYGQSKYIAEQMMQWYGKLFDMKYTILRYFNVCGASDDGSIGDSKKPSSLLVQNAVRGALGIEPFKLTCAQVETPDGSPIRDYINVVDLVEAHLSALNYLNNGGASEICNLGTGVGNSVLEIVNTVQKITGKTFEVTQAEPRKGESSKIYADITKAKTVLKWSPKRSIEDSVNSLVKWYSKNPKGWEY